MGFLEQQFYGEYEEEYERTFFQVEFHWEGRLLVTSEELQRIRFFSQITW